MNQGGPHPGNLIRDNGGPYSARAESNASVHRSFSHGLGQGDDKIGIIIVRIEHFGAKVRYLVPCLDEGGSHPLLHGEAAVIGGDADSHNLYPFRQSNTLSTLRRRSERRMLALSIKKNVTVDSVEQSTVTFSDSISLANAQTLTLQAFIPRPDTVIVGRIPLNLPGFLNGGPSLPVEQEAAGHAVDNAGG
jgi:hypothetical protein